jgi:hypothetical protein
VLVRAVDATLGPHRRKSISAERKAQVRLLCEFWHGTGQTRTAILPQLTQPAKLQLTEPASSSGAVQGAVLDEHQHAQASQQHGVHMQEVDHENPRRLVLQELPPGRA